MRLGDFSAWVLIDGNELEEFSFAVSPSGHEAVCWIASEEGKKFAVTWKCWAPIRDEANAGIVIVDGVRCRPSVMFPGNFGCEDTLERTYISDAISTRDFIFSRLHSTDEDTSLHNLPLDGLGEIRLKIRHGTNELRKTSRNDEFLNFPEPSKVYERTKTTMGHCIIFGDVVKRPPNASPYDFRPNDKPPTEFVFKYGPIDLLQENCIAPSRVTSQKKRSLPTGELDVNISAGLSSKDQSLENESKRLCPQAGLFPDRKPKRIKSEGSYHKRSSFSPIEVVCLT